jgi:integrase
VRRRTGNGLELQPLKTKYSRRNLPIPWTLADRLRALRVQPDSLVFCEPDGTPHDPNNFNTRVLRPALEEAGLSVGDGRWGFHSFRHHIASEMLAQGRTIVQISRWLGHSSPGFTLDHYIHLMNEDDLGGPMDLPTLGENREDCERSETPGNPPMPAPGAAAVTVAA